METQFEEAGKLIRAKRFDEARRILAAIDHPKATRWLQRLDEIAPRPMNTAAETDDESRLDALLDQPDAPAESDTSLPKKKVKLPWGEPWNPHPGGIGAPILSVMSFFMPFIVIPFWNIYLALNWRRLGKPGWMKLSLAASIVAGGGFWLCFPLLAAIGKITGGIAVNVVWAGIMSLAFFTFWLWLVMQQLQAAAYKQWTEQHNAEALYQYPYRVRRSMLMNGAGVVIFGIVGLLFVSYQAQPLTFTDSAMTLQYPSGWDSVDIHESTLCTQMEADQRCVVVLQEGRFGYSGLVIYENPLPEAMTLDEVDNAFWRNISTSDGGVLDSKWQTMIDGQPARVRQYTFNDGSDKTWYGMLMVFLNNDNIYRLFVYSSSKAIFEEHRRTIDQIYPSIRFTAQQ